VTCKQFLGIDSKSSLAISKGNGVFASMTSIESFLHPMERILKMSKSPIITKTKTLPPVTPGEILRVEFLEPSDMTANKLATLLGVPPSRIQAIIKEQREITADTAIRLSKLFGTSVEFWLNLQSNYELSLLEYNGEKKRIESEVRPLAVNNGRSPKRIR
jgi:addiction module HigA family antidote